MESYAECELSHRRQQNSGVSLSFEIIDWMGRMRDEYAYLRGQYEEIVRHCDYLLHNSADPKVLAKANESKQKASAELARLNRQMVGIATTNG